jgi:LPS-assembly lipoprotein
MWWRERRQGCGRTARLVVVLAAASLTAGCFEPLYGAHPSNGSESVRDKLAAVEIPVIHVPQGSPATRVAVALRNALQYDLNGSAGASAPTHRLDINIGVGEITVVINPNTGRPETQIAGVSATYRLIEIATSKIVVSDSAYARVSYDIPGQEQRFAAQRAQRDAEDRAVETAAEAIRNRLASYFVAGT